MRCSASLDRCLNTRTFFFLLILFSLHIHRPGFSQMEVAKHSRPALHNLRMEEGGSASHYTLHTGHDDDDDDDDEAHKKRGASVCAHPALIDSSGYSS